MDVAKIIASLSQTEKVKIVVFGDYALDEYLYIDPTHDELSAETEKIAYQIHRKFLSPGVGGTITNNLCALGAQVICIGIAGNDGQGYELLECLHAIGADITHMVHSDTLCTCTYLKPMRKDADGTYREMNRLDFRNFTEPPMEVQQEMIHQLISVLDWADGVIITDQFYQRNMGAVTDWLRKQLSALAALRKDKIFYADSRSFVSEYQNMMVKCNNIEFFSMLGRQKTHETGLGDIIEQGEVLYRRNGCPLFVTCGKEGIVVLDGTASIIPAFRVDSEIDVVGAGDATNAGLVLGMALGLSVKESALLACCVSSITIQQIGTTGIASIGQVVERLSALQ